MEREPDMLNGIGLRPGRHPALAAVTIAAGLAATVSGCASGSGGGGGNGGGSSGSTASVTLGNPAATYGEAAYVVADKQGYLSKNGISSKSVLLSSSSTLLAALVSGGVDFGTTNGAAVLAARAKGVPVVAVCGLSQGVPGLAMVVKPSLMKSLHLVPGDVSGDLKKMKGQVIGVNSPTATGGKILAGLEQDAGLPKNYVTETTVASSTMVAALQHGEIGGFFQDIPVPQQAISKGVGTVAFDTSQVASLKDIQYNVIATSENYLKTHAAAVKSFVAGIKQGEADLQAKNSAALNDIGNIYPGVDPKVVQNAATTGLETNCSMPQAAWGALTSVATKWGLVPKSTTAAQVASAYQAGL
jgi:ABC-type nitrate/sulfonate/bicarbonate transport system substrate-binding protein